MTANPYADTTVRQSLLQRETERAIENLHRNAKKIVDDYEIPMPVALEFMATLGPLEEAALSIPKGQDYMDKLMKFCLAESLKNMPPVDPEQAKLYSKGNPKGRRVKTEGLKMPKFTGIVNRQEPLDDAAPTSEPTTVLGNPITDVAPAVEVPQDIKDKMEAIKASAQEPDLSDVANLKKAATVDFDPLTGKPDDEIIPVEIVSEADEFLGPKVEREPLPMLDPNKEVARILKEAFPGTTDEYKLRFFRETVGFKLVTECVLSMGASDMYRTLNDAIAAAKANPIETVSEPKASGEIATEKPTENGQSAVATHTESIEPKQEQPLPQNSTNSMAVAVIPKSEVAPVQSAIGFRIPSPEQFGYMQQLAKFVAQSGFYKDVNTEAKAMVIFMKGYSLNIEPMTALDGIFVISGRPYIGAKLVKGLLEATGQCQRFDIFGDEHQCTVTIQRKGRPTPNVYKFTMEEARAAKLMGSGMYEKWPAQMLRWRAIKQAVDTDFPELGFGLGRDDDEAEAA